MSDYEYEDPGSGDDWPGSGDDNNNENEDEIMIENTYYEADDLKKKSPKEALELFESVVMLESSKEEITWRFKALENIIILLAQLGDFNKMVDRHRELLKLLNKVTRNDASDAVNNILDTIANVVKDEDIRQQMYELTLDVLKTNNERLWFSICLKLGKIYLDRREFASLERLLNELKSTCTGDSSDWDMAKNKGPQEFDPAKGNLLEVYALEIQMYTATKNKRKLKEIYAKTTNLNSVINDPRVMGIIKESGGKMYMSEKNWEKAMIEIFEAFKNYQESGNPRAKVVLKYVALASIMCRSEINPFDSREAKVYKDDPEIEVLINLRDAFEKNDFNEIQKILSNSSYNIMEDPFVKEYMQDLMSNIRLNVIVAKIRPYRKVRISHLASDLQIPEREVVALLMDLILDNKVHGKIDQVNGYLEILSTGETNQDTRNKSLKKWIDALNSITSNLCDMVK